MLFRSDARAAEEQRKAEEERRRSAERRAQAAGVAGAPLAGEPGSQRVAAHSAPLRSNDGHYAQHSSSGGGVPRQPERVVPAPSGPVTPLAPSLVQDTATSPNINAQYGRPRASSQAQQSQPRPAPAYEPAPGGDSRRPPPMQQHARRPSGQAGLSQAGPSSAGLQATTSSAGQSGSQQQIGRAHV